MEFISIASSSHGNAYLVKSPGVAPLLLECGIPIKKLKESLSYGLSGLAGCLISHEHMDHAKAVKDLLKAGVDCYMPYQCALALGVENHYRTHQVISDCGFYIERFNILPFALRHDVPTQGFLIQAPDGDSLAFIPDTEYVYNQIKGVTIIAIECNHLSEALSDNIQGGNIPGSVGRRIRHNHMSLETTISMLRANDLSRCRAVYLLHLSDTNSSEELMKTKIQEAIGIPVYICKE
jgi:phosphoribosyl 1,2-cyclic phosphodiesterase